MTTLPFGQIDNIEYLVRDTINDNIDGQPKEDWHDIIKDTVELICEYVKDFADDMENGLFD